MNIYATRKPWTRFGPGVPATRRPVQLARDPHPRRGSGCRSWPGLPTPYTLHPTPYTLHPTPYTPHPAPYTPHPTPSTPHVERFVFFFITLEPRVEWYTSRLWPSIGQVESCLWFDLAWYSSWIRSGQRKLLHIGFTLTSLNQLCSNFRCQFVRTIFKLNTHRDEITLRDGLWWSLTRREDAPIWDRPKLVHHRTYFSRAFAVKVVPKRLPVFPFYGLLKGCKGHKTHLFENGGTNQIRKTGKREVVFLQPLPQTLYGKGIKLKPF